MTQLRKRVAHVLAREVEDGILLLDTESNQIHQFNETARFIWEQCDQAESAEAIAELVAREFNIAEEVAARDVGELLKRLQALNLVEVA